MKIVIRLLLSLIGFGGALAFTYYLDPAALDAMGFAFLYLSLIVGMYNLCLLLLLTSLQAGLLTFLLIAFLLLQQLRLFAFWEGAILVAAVVAFEQYKGRKSVTRT